MVGASAAKNYPHHLRTKRATGYTGGLTFQRILNLISWKAKVGYGSYRFADYPYLWNNQPCYGFYRLAPVQGVPLHRLRAGPEQPHTSATSVEMKVHFGCANRLEEILVILHLQKWLGYVRFIFRVKLFRPQKPSNKWDQWGIHIQYPQYRSISISNTVMAISISISINI